MLALKLYLLLALSLPSCAVAKSYSPNSALIRLWEDVKAGEPMPPPYLTVYRDGKKELRFIAACHGSDAGTFSLIRDAFSDPPGVVAIEGQSSEDGYSPKRVIDLMDGEALYGKGEPYYAANLALRNRIPFIGGEPSDRQLLDAVVRGGFSAKDLQGYECLRTMIGGPGQLGDAEPTFANEKESFKQRYSIDDDSSLLKDETEFDAWRAKNYGVDGQGDLARHRGKRFVGPEGGFGHRLGNLVSNARNAHIAQVIADMLNKHDKVLVVYGAGHRMELAAALEGMLGKPAVVRSAFLDAQAGISPVTEERIVGEAFEGRRGKVLQSERSRRDFFVEKREGRFCVRQYRFSHLFEDESFLGESCFKTVDEVNEHLSPFFQRGD